MALEALAIVVSVFTLIVASGLTAWANVVAHRAQDVAERAATATERAVEIAEREAQQARRVAAWMVYREFRGGWWWMTELANTSELPVYDWWLEYRVELENGDVYTCATRTNFLYKSPLSPRMEMPNQALYKPMFDYLPKLEQLQSWKVTVRIDFRDADGRYWSRGHDGQLVELTEPRNPVRRVVHLNGKPLPVGN